MLKTGCAFAISICALAGTVLAGEDAPRTKPPYDDDPATVAKLEGLADRTGLKLDAAKLQGKDLEKWRQQFYRRGPENRNYCVKMAYNPDRRTAFFCGGNHGVPHKLADAWEYHLGSNTWTLLAPPEVGNPKGIIGLYGSVEKGREAAALEMVKKHVILEDGCLVTRETGGPINTLHTWDGLTYDPKVKRALWAAPGTGIGNDALARLYAEANGLKVEDVKAKLAPGIGNFWMYDFEKNRWKRHVGPGPYPQLRYTITMTFIPDLGKTLFYGQYNGETWTYDAVANKWAKLAAKGKGPGIEMMSAYSPKHKKLVSVQGKDTWTFDIATSTWAKVATDDRNQAHDARSFFGYDAGNDVFLLCQPGVADKVRAFSLEKNEWTTPEIKGDGPPGNKNLQGYYDPDRNVLVACEGLSVWVYRYAKHRK